MPMNPTTEAEAPTLSLGERDRRWRAVRALMESHDLDLLLIGGFRGREQYDSYVTDDFVEGCAVFGLAGEPTVCTFNNSRIYRAFQSFERGTEPWTSDYRVITGGKSIADICAERGRTRGRIGVVGLVSRGPTEPKGLFSHLLWKELVEAMPDAEWVDIWRPYSELMLAKSAEEIALVRYAADGAEAACHAMLAATRPGVGEDKIYAAVAHALFTRGLNVRYPSLILQSGPHNLSWGPPRWTVRAERPRRVETGDMVQAEIFAVWGNQEIQVQMSVALDPVMDVDRHCESVARECYEAGLEVLRPGITFADLVHAMEKPLVTGGCWANTPLVHTLGPQSGFTGGTKVNAHMAVGPKAALAGAGRPLTNGDLVIREGMVFAFEPEASIENHRINLGGAVLVTTAGCEELNRLPTHINHVRA
jgi:Xaa-Pro aminopeptidase